MLRRYEELKSMYDHEKSMSEFLKECGHADKIRHVHADYALQRHEYIRKIDRNYTDQLMKPITEEWRTIVDDPEDIALSGYDYRIFRTETPDEWTDDEIEEFIMDEVGYPPICSPYDCTGRRFTSWVSWSRQPVGIVMIHRWGTDL